MDGTERAHLLAHRLVIERLLARLYANDRPGLASLEAECLGVEHGMYATISGEAHHVALQSMLASVEELFAGVREVR